MRLSVKKDGSNWLKLFLMALGCWFVQCSLKKINIWHKCAWNSNMSCHHCGTKHPKGCIDLMLTSWSWKWIKINSLNSSHLQLTWNTSFYSKWIIDSQQWDLHPLHGL